MGRLCIPLHVTTTSFDGSVVLLDLRKNAYYALNSSASDLWKLLVKDVSYEKALQELMEIYAAPTDMMRKDMEDLVQSLIQAGLLERKSELQIDF